MAKPFNISLNVRLHLIIALGRREHIWDYIDYLYNEKKWDYYQAYKNGSYVEDISKDTFSALTEEHIMKCMGIAEWCYTNNDMTVLYALIKKGFKNAWNFFKAHCSEGSLIIDNYSALFLKRNNNNLDNFTEEELYDELLVLTYLCYVNDVDVLGIAVPKMLEQYNISFHKDVFARGIRDSIQEKERLKPQFQKQLSQIYEDIGVPEKFLKQPKTLNAILEKIIQTGEQRTHKALYNKPLVKNGEASTDLTQEEYYDFRHEVFKEKYCRYIGNLSLFTKISGIGEEFSSRVTISKADMDLLIEHYLLSVQEGQAKKEDVEGFMICYLFLYGFIQLYKDLKKQYLYNAKDEEYAEMLALEERITKKQKEIVDTKKSYNEQIIKLKNEIYSLKEVATVAEQETKQLQSQLKEYEDNTKELIALREFVYNKDIPIEEDSDRIEDMISFINNKRFAVVGGHPIWHSKLKETFPKATLVSPEQLNINLSFINNLDAVFVHTSYLNHSMYKKLMNTMRANNVKLGYIDNVNMELTTNTFYHTLK